MGLFGFHVALNRNHVILTGSEADAMAVYQSTGVPAIALPRGITTLPQEVRGTRSASILCTLP